MDIERVDPRLRDIALEPRLDFEVPGILADARQWLESIPRLTDLKSVQRERVQVGGRDAVLYYPEGSRGSGLVWFHGGGLIAGSPVMDDAFCVETAHEIGVTILSLDYRLAPEHPFPAAIDDGILGWDWLMSNCNRLGLLPGRIAVGGQSAGGGLAASLSQRLLDAGMPAAAQWLWCPMLDDRTAANRALDEVDHFVWNNRANRFGWSAYLGLEPGTAEIPEYASSARRNDLAGLPPTWMYASDIDLFYGEEMVYVSRLRNAGVSVALEVIRGAPHGFEAQGKSSVPARRLRQAGQAWLADALAPGAP